MSGERVPKQRPRWSYLLVSEQQVLRDWGVACSSILPDAPTVYQVGSSLFRLNYRDVDVRQIVPDEDYERLAAAVNLSRFRLTVSLWGQKVTGLPVDYDIQAMTAANEEYPMEDHPRNALIQVDATWPVVSSGGAL